MTIEALKIGFDSWVRVDTWDTGHPLDEKRFNLALKSCVEKCGPSLDGEDIYNAIYQLARSYHPNVNAAVHEDSAQKFALKAEAICAYLFDIRNS